MEENKANKPLATKEEIYILDEYNTIKADLTLAISKIKAIPVNKVYDKSARQRAITITKLEEAVHRINDCIEIHKLEQVIRYESNAIPMHPITANTISFIGYNQEESILYIKFKDNTVYKYFDVPMVCFYELKTNEDPDEYMNTDIRHFKGELI